MQIQGLSITQRFQEYFVLILPLPVYYPSWGKPGLNMSLSLTIGQNLGYADYGTACAPSGRLFCRVCLTDFPTDVPLPFWADDYNRSWIRHKKPDPPVRFCHVFSTLAFLSAYFRGGREEAMSGVHFAIQISNNIACCRARKGEMKALKLRKSAWLGRRWPCVGRARTNMKQQHEGIKAEEVGPTVFLKTSVFFAYASKLLASPAVAPSTRLYIQLETCALSASSPLLPPRSRPSWLLVL